MGYLDSGVWRQASRLAGLVRLDVGELDIDYEIWINLNNISLHQQQHWCSSLLHGTLMELLHCIHKEGHSTSPNISTILYTTPTHNVEGGWLLKNNRQTPNKKYIHQKMVSTVSLLLGGDFSIICFCKSMKLIPLFANNLLRLITESSLYFAMARSACTNSYLQVIRQCQLKMWELGRREFQQTDPYAGWAPINATAIIVQLWAAVTPLGSSSNTTHFEGLRSNCMEEEKKNSRSVSNIS